MARKASSEANVLPSAGALTLDLRGRKLGLGGGCMRVMGIVNVTPDSFSDGGRFLDAGAAIGHALRLEAEGADVIDIGGESTRPGAAPLSVEEELARVLPVIEGVRKASGVPISIDTYKAAVARRALLAGADIVNDISALNFDGEMAGVIAEFGAPVVLMHIKGTPRDMQQSPRYADVVAEVKEYLLRSLRKLEESGAPVAKAIIDPGIGFGKTAGHNLEIMKRIGEFAELGRPVMVGFSRKSTIGKALGGEAGDRLEGTLAVTAFCALRGVAMVRVHDVKENVRVIRMIEAIAKGASFDGSA